MGGWILRNECHLKSAQLFTMKWELVKVRQKNIKCQCPTTKNMKAYRNCWHIKLIRNFGFSLFAIAVAAIRVVVVVVLVVRVRTDVVHLDDGGRMSGLKKQSKL